MCRLDSRYNVTTIFIFSFMRNDFHLSFQEVQGEQGNI